MIEGLYNGKIHDLEMLSAWAKAIWSHEALVDAEVGARRRMDRDVFKGEDTGRHATTFYARIHQVSTHKGFLELSIEHELPWGIQPPVVGFASAFNEKAKELLEELTERVELDRLRAKYKGKDDG